MNDSQFWQLIDHSRQAARGSCERMADALTESLKCLTPAEIIEFDRLFWARMAESYRWDLWAAAFIVRGGCSDDAFDYFRAWLIARGSAVFAAALRDPARAFDDIDVSADAQCEDVLSAASDAYQAVTGSEIPTPHTPSVPPEPSGDAWDEATVDNLFPDLARRFGKNPIPQSPPKRWWQFWL